MRNLKLILPLLIFTLPYLAFGAGGSTDLGGSGVPLSSVGAPNGVASLDGTGKVPASELPGGGGGGSVTSVSVVSANGLAGTVANPTTTPAITLSTSITGLLKGNGTAISAAIAGTDYMAALAGTTSQYVRGDGSLATLDTSVVPENTNLYFTNARAQGAVSASPPLVDTVGVFSIPVSTNAVDGYLSAADHTSFAAKQASISTSSAPANQFGTGFTAPNTFTYAQPSFSNLSGNLVDSQMPTYTNHAVMLGTGAAGLGATAVGASNTFLHGNTGADPSYSPVDLSSADATGILAAARFPALLDDVTTSSGSLHTIVSADLDNRYVNFVDGDDALGIGTVLKPWKTIQHACTAIAGSVTINRPFTIHLSGGNNDTDSGAVNCPVNIAIVSDQLIQTTGTLTFVGTLNDTVSITNVIVADFNWVRNDIYFLQLNLNNAAFAAGPTFKQNGAGAASIQAIQSTFVNMDVKLPKAGSYFGACNFVASETFEDSDTNAYYVFSSGYIDAPVSFSGGPYIYMSGVNADVPFGYTLTTATTANGTPTIQADSSSIPPSISGPNNLYLSSFAQHESYSPATPGNWSPAPSDVASALDQLAGRSPLSSTLTSAHIFVGNGSNVATDVAASGDLTLANTGAFTIANSAVTNAKIANGTIDLTAKVTGILPVANGGTNSSTALSNNRVMKSSGGAIVEAAAITANRALASDANGIPVASATTDTELGYVSGVTSAIQTQLNGKQASGNYITALTGDATASGPGSAALTLATVNGNVGSFGDASHSLSVTANAKGLLTAVSTNSIQIAESQVTSLVSDLALKQNAALSVVDGGNAAYAILAADNHVRTSTALTADRTYTLPVCAANIGEWHEVKNTPAQTFNIILAGNGGDLIDGAASLTIYPSQSLKVVCGVSGTWDIE